MVPVLGRGLGEGVLVLEVGLVPVVLVVSVVLVLG
jgi:hypothetical protein